LIREEVGRSAQEIVADALDRRIISSTGRELLAGQVGALAKMYKQGRLPDVWRDESVRPYRYYPKTSDGSTPEPVRPSPVRLGTASVLAQAITFRPSPEQDKALTALVSVGACSNRSDAIHWLLDQGLAAKDEFIKQALEAHQQIEDLRTGIKSLIPQ
jgi:hypothetical protein